MNQLEPLIQRDQLTQLAILLRQSLAGTNQKETFAAIKQLEEKPESYLYFLTLLISPLFEETLKELAGLTLKNIMKRNLETLSPQILGIIKSVIFEQYDVQQGKVLKTLGLILGLIVEEMDFDADTLAFLLQKAQQGNVFAIESLKRIVEDFRVSSENLDMLNSERFASLVQKLVVILLPQCQGPNKQHAIDCFNMLIYPMPVSMVSVLHPYIEILRGELDNPDPAISLKVMEGFEAIASTRKDLISEQIVHMVALTNFKDEKVVKVEANFWIEVLDSDSSQLVKPILSNLLAKWIAGMVLTQEDISNLMETNKYNNQKQDDSTRNEEEEEDEIAKGGDYTLRKRCGFIINKLSLLFCEELWDASKELVSQLIQHEDWMRKEVAILYIGLIAENCSESVKGNFREVVQTISASMSNSPEYLLKSTCLWTLSKYTVQLINLSNEDQSVLTGYITLILQSMSEQHSNVRSASCTTLSSLIEEIKDKITPWLNPILATAASALQKYRGHSLYCLFQLYQTFASEISEEHFSHQITNQVLVPLCTKWSSLSNNDTDLCPLIECMVTLCEKAKKNVGVYAVDLFRKSMELFNPAHKEIFMRIVDLIEVLIVNSPSYIHEVFLQSGLTEKVVTLISQSNHQTKQTCYSLLSNIAQVFGLSNPLEVMAEVYQSINLNKESQVNNGLFCMVEILLKYPEIADYAEPCAKLAIQFLLKNGQRNPYPINFSKVIGLIATIHPSLLAPHLHSFFREFCRAVKTSSEHNLKFHRSINGMIRLIQLNPQGVFSEFKYFVDVCVCMRDPPEENVEGFRHLVRCYREKVGERSWEMFLNDPYFLPGAVNKIKELVQ